MNDVDIAVVGGGLGGLTTALLLARQGHRVTIFEGAQALGGRARSSKKHDFVLNRGAHALYQGGPATRVLSQLGIQPAGAAPSLGGALVESEGRLHTLPSGPLSLLVTSLLSLRDKLKVGRLLSHIPGMVPTDWEGQSASQWLDSLELSYAARRLMEANLRILTYSDCPDELMAPPVIRQFQRGLTGGVHYLDGGWQKLVDALVHGAIEAGVEIHRQQKVRAVLNDRVEIDGGSVAARRVILALPLGATRKLLVPDLHGALPTQPRRIRAFCLDVALRSLPQPRRTFCTGIERPFYYSVHSAAAQLAPSGGAVIHCARYLAPDEMVDHERSRDELEGILDVLQPGWRQLLVTEQILPQIEVMSAAPTARGRARFDALAHRGIYFVGDWIGDEFLSDAVFESAHETASAIGAINGVRKVA